MLLKPERRRFLHAVSAAATTAVLPRVVTAQDAIYLYNWDDYINDAVLKDFGKQFIVKVHMDLFADGGEQFAKLRLGNSGYDVTFPTQDTVERLWRNGLLTPLDHSLIPNLVNISERFQSPPYDPGNRYSVPYMWGVLGIGHRKNVKFPVSWRDLLTADGIKKFGRIAWISEVSSMYHIAALMLNKSINDFSPATQAEIFSIFRKAKSELTVVAPDNGQDLLAAGEVDYAIEWNGDISTLIDEDDNIAFTIPEEGTFSFVDCMCIPTDAPNPELAHEFINNILDPHVGSKLAQYIGYATPNQAAYELTANEYRSNTTIFPPTATKTEIAVYPGEKALQLMHQNWENALTS